MDKLDLDYLTVFASYRCNFHCMGCGVFSPYTRASGGMTDQLREQLVKVREAVKSIGRLSISGGEPFLLPDLGDFISEVVSLLGVPIGYVELFTNGSILLEDPFRVLDVADHVHKLRVSVHPELRNRFLSDNSLLNHLQRIASMVPDIRTVVVYNCHFLLRYLSRDRRDGPAPSCRYPYANDCLSISEEGFHKCGLSHKALMASNPYRSPAVVESAQKSTAPVDAQSLRELLAGPIDLCYFCDGDAGDKIKQLDGLPQESFEVPCPPPYAERLKCPDMDILIPYKRDSAARERNLHRLVIHLHSIIEDPHILVIEGDKESTIPENLKRYIDHIFVRTDGLFSHSNLVNIGITWTKRPIVFLQGGDVLTRQDALRAALDQLSDGQIMIPQNRVANISQEYLDAFPLVYTTDYTGHAIPTERFNSEIYGGVLATRRVYDKVGLYGKQFEGWGHEDFEFEKRCERQGITTARADCTSVHMDHPLDSEYYNSEVSNKNKTLAVKALGELTNSGQARA